MNQPPDPATSVDEALERLVDLPPMAELGIAMAAIAPDATGALTAGRIELSTKAQAQVAEFAEKSAATLSESTLIAYGPATLIPPQHWMFVKEGAAATLAEVDALVAGQDMPAFDAYDGRRIKLIAARFTTTDLRSVTFYRIAEPLTQLIKSKVLGLIRLGGVYDQLESSDVLLLKPPFDVIVIDGFAFFRGKAAFERAFGFLQELQKQSTVTFDEVTAHLKIRGVEALRQACTSQPQMMAKMSSIKRSMDDDSEYAAAMTMPRLIDYIVAHPHVDIEVVGSAETSELVFDSSVKRRFQILKLLDDDFLHSVLTQRDYEANSKVQPSAAE